MIVMGAYLKHSQLLGVRSRSKLLLDSGSGPAPGEGGQLPEPPSLRPDEAGAVQVVDRGRVLHRLALAVGPTMNQQDTVEQ